VIRPTGLLDPPVEIRPVETQVDDLLSEIRIVAEQGMRVLCTTLTKRMAEDLTEYLHEQGIRVRYMHSDIDTLERIEILRDLDADKEGFLRSETSLVQTIGRAARNAEGRVIMYADKITGSMERALGETNRRRAKQEAYNVEHGITPATVKKNVSDVMEGLWQGDTDQSRVTTKIDKAMVGDNLRTHLEAMRKDMRKAAENLEFERLRRLQRQQ